MQEKLYDMLLEENEVTWQSIIYGLIRSEEMDPWDIDVSLLTKKYIETIKDLELTDFLISGKVLLASAILVKIKSHKFINEDIASFDDYLFHSEEEEGLESLEDFEDGKRRFAGDVPGLGVKTPQARKRRVSVNDLVFALEKALKVNKRRVLRREAYLNFERPKIPEKKINITFLIRNLFEKIKSLFKKNEVVTFDNLVPEGGGREEKILTFVPLLHLANQQEVNINQEHHFGPIHVSLKAE